MTKLSVNINKVALIRNSRAGNNPDVVQFAEKCLANGANGITLHPRPDQRHARYQDVFDLKKLVANFPGTELNVEGNPTPEFLKVVLQAKPDQCTLVPDAPGQLTSDHGWALTTEGKRIQPIIQELKDAGIRVSLFVDPKIEEIKVAHEIGADRVELYTEPYAKTFAKSYPTPERIKVLATYKEATTFAVQLHLGVNAGHDLSLENLAAFLEIPDILEVSIGHALIVECLTLGLEKTIASYLKIIS